MIYEMLDASARVKLRLAINESFDYPVPELYGTIR